MARQKGFIYLHRSLLEDRHYFDEKFDRIRCWIDLLLLAEWKDGRVYSRRNIEITLKRGQIATSVQQLAERWQLAKNTVQARLQELEEDERITLQRDNVCTLITIVNYDRYQTMSEEVSAYQNIETDTQIDTQKQKQNDTQIESASTTFSSGYESETKNTDTQIDTQISAYSDTLPNNKNNINNNLQHTTAHTHESDFFESLKSEQYYCEVTAMQFHLKSLAEVHEYIEQFRRHCILGDITHSDYSDCKRHFRDWLKFQVNNKTKQNETDIHTRTNAQRRGTDVEATSAQSYEGEF